MKKYVVDLSKEEKERLKELTSKGTTTGARRLRRTHTLLLANEGMVDQGMARVLNGSVRRSWAAITPTRSDGREGYVGGSSQLPENTLSKTSLLNFTPKDHVFAGSSTACCGLLGDKEGRIVSDLGWCCEHHVGLPGARDREGASADVLFSR